MRRAASLFLACTQLGACIQLQSRPLQRWCACGARGAAPLAATTCGTYGALPLLASDDESGSAVSGISASAVSFLKGYKKVISPLLPPGCRFIPTCSEYAIQSFERFSPPQAAVLTAWRLVRCNPLHVSGYGSGVDEPCWPPPAYWGGSGTVRTPLDDERSRQRAAGNFEAEPEPSFLDAPFAAFDDTRGAEGGAGPKGDRADGSER